MEQATIKVNGMSCQHCVSSIEKALSASGVAGRVDLDKNEVEVNFESGAIDLAKIGAIIEDQGYDVVSSAAR